MVSHSSVLVRVYCNIAIKSHFGNAPSFSKKLDRIKKYWIKLLENLFSYCLGSFLRDEAITVHVA